MRFKINITILPIGRFLLVGLFVSGGLRAEIDEHSLNSAIFHFGNGRYDEAIGLLDTLSEAEPKNGEIHYWLGKAAFLQRRPKEASEYYGQALELGHETADVYFSLGQALGAWAMDASIFTQARLAGKIRRAFEDSLELDPDHFDANVALMLFYEQAPAFMGGNFEKAVTLGEKARSLKLVEGSYALADMYFRKKKRAEAIQVAEELVEVDSNDPDHWVFLLAFLLNAERFEEWPERYLNFENKFGHYPSAQYQFGKYGALTGLQLEKAENSLLDYLDLKTEEGPSFAHAHWRLGQVLEKAKKFEEALAAYKRAMEMNSKEKDFRAAHRRLSRYISKYK